MAGVLPETIYTKGSAIYFKNGLVPLIPGSALSPTGIPTYLLTKEEAYYYYYNKVASDARFVNQAGDEFEGELYMVPKSGNSIRFSGIKYDDAADYGLTTGWQWLNDEATPLPIAWIKRSGTSTDSKVEIGITEESGATPTMLTLKSDGTFQISKTKAISELKDVLTWATGIKKSGDTIIGGTYEFKNGKIDFFTPTDVEDNYAKVMSFEYSTLDSNLINVIDLKGHVITGSGTPTGDTDLVPLGFANTTYVPAVELESEIKKLIIKNWSI